MQTVAITLSILASIPYIWLGTVHMLLTFRGKSFHAADEAVNEAMKHTHMNFTRRSSLWNVWIGFNGSHSLGAMFFGLATLILAVFYDHLLLHAPLLQILVLAVAAFYVFLAKKYWFRTPFIGTVVALVCFAAAFLLAAFSE